MNEDGDQLELIETQGPWPFITRRTFRRADRSLLLRESRRHRKRLHGDAPGRVLTFGAVLLRSLWMPRQLNWWIGTIFALGSLLFALGSVLSLAPALARAWSLDAVAVNAIFFAGSIPFTTAAYLQLFQAANADRATSQQVQGSGRRAVFGWRPEDVGWLSSALQLAGTVLFNVNTLDAMLPGLDWLQQDLVIWTPDVAGSILFLASGYLAFGETCHAHWAWKPKSLSWWVTFANLLGCVAFMISAVFAFVPPRTADIDALTISITFTLLGAIGFLIGSLLMLPEAAAAVEE